MSQTSPSDLEKVIGPALAGPRQRTQRITVKGNSYWLKRRESTGPLRQLQKGSPAAAFERERTALHWCAGRGLPMPAIVLEGADWFVVPDCGPPIEQFMGQQAENTAVFAAAGTALASLHDRKVSHGRPALKDICWQDGCITFIDLENFRHKRNTPQGHGRDLIIFALNGFAIGDGPTPAVRTALDHYRKADRNNIWGEARKICKKLRWADRATKLIQRSKPGKSREFKAIPHVLELFS